MMFDKVPAVKNPRAVRERLEVNQQEFWERLGVTQSAGSRYESGRPLPQPLRMLFHVAYGDQPVADKLLKRLQWPA